MEKRAAVARVWAYLNFKPAAQWLALIAGVTACIPATALLLVLGAFFYLLLLGRLPTVGITVSPHLSLENLGALAVIALVLTVLWSGLLLLMHHLAALAVIEATLRMRRAVFHHSYRLGTLTVRAQGPAEAVSLATGHIEAIHDALYAWLTITVRTPVQLALLLLVACWINFWLTAVVLAGAGLAWLIAAQCKTYFGRHEARALHQAANQLALLQENLMFIRLIKACIMELFNQGRIDRELTSYARAQHQGAVGAANLRLLLAFLCTLAGIALAFLVGMTVLDGQLGLAGALLLTAVLASMIWPLSCWLEHRPVLRRGEQSAVALAKFLDRPRDVVQEAGATALPPLSRRLEFDNVSLREPGTNRMLLQGISLTLSAGQHLALVGPDAVEKLALVQLLPRFLDPTSGEIRIDDHNLRSITLESLRKQVGLVLQYNLVFSDTVGTNIGCGNAAFKQPQIIEAAKLAHAHQFIQKLPKGYDTPIGDTGHPLNVGEKFRIAMARAILRDPTLYIIEEPPASYLDEDTGDLLDDTFARVLSGRTVIFLPHRMRTIQSCSEVLLIHKGRAEARGAPDELAQQSALYQHLYYMEFNDFAGQL